MKRLFPEYGIWTPENIISPLSLKINLNPLFAQMARDTKVSKGEQESLDSRVRKMLGDVLKYAPSNMYTFAEDSMLITGIYLGGGDGLWMTLDYGQTHAKEFPKDRPLEYYSHNLDIARDAVRFQVLFEYWVTWVQVIQEETEMT